jgi:hypothetical protein
MKEGIMGRAIVTAPGQRGIRMAFPGLARKRALQEKPPPEPPDGYRDRLMKYIPAEVVTLYVGLTTLVSTAKATPHLLYWVAFVVCLIGTPFYLWRIQKVTSAVQLIISTLGFVVWASVMGEPFTSIHQYNVVYGEFGLPVFTFFVALISPPPQKA